MEAYQILLLIAIILENIHFYIYPGSRKRILNKSTVLIILGIIVVLFPMLVFWGPTSLVESIMKWIKWICLAIGITGILYYGFLILKSVLSQAKSY